MVSANVKLLAVGTPVGREVRRISRLVMGLVIEKVVSFGGWMPQRVVSFECLDQRLELHTQSFVVPRHRRNLPLDTEQLIDGHLRRTH